MFLYFNSECSLNTHLFMWTYLGTLHIPKQTWSEAIPAFHPDSHTVIFICCFKLEEGNVDTNKYMCDYEFIQSCVVNILFSVLCRTSREAPANRWYILGISGMKVHECLSKSHQPDLLMIHLSQAICRNYLSVIKQRGTKNKTNYSYKKTLLWLN